MWPSVIIVPEQRLDSISSGGILMFVVLRATEMSITVIMEKLQVIRLIDSLRPPY